MHVTQTSLIIGIKMERRLHHYQYYLNASVCARSAGDEGALFVILLALFIQKFGLSSSGYFISPSKSVFFDDLRVARVVCAYALFT